MHICMILPSYQGENAFQSGAELQAHTQIQLLKNLGCKITVITKRRSQQSTYNETLDGVTIFRVFPTGLRTIRAAFLLLKMRKQFDVVHIHGQHLFSMPIIFLCRMLGIPTVLKITIAGQTKSPMSFDKIFPAGWNPLRKAMNWVSRLTSAYLAISSEIAEELKNQNVPADKIIELPNGVNLKRFHPVNSASKQQLRTALGLPQDKKIVLFASRLIWRKGIDLMLKSWENIFRDNPGTILVLVGKESSEALPLINTLKQNLGGNVLICKGEVPDTAPYLQASDIFVFPSRQEGLPNGLLEAMACGCACVSSDIGGCTDLIDSGKTGLLFPSGDKAALADVVSQLLAQSELADALGTKALEKVEKNYDIIVIASKLNALYTNLVAGRHNINKKTTNKQKDVSHV